MPHTKAVVAYTDRPTTSDIVGAMPHGKLTGDVARWDADGQRKTLRVRWVDGEEEDAIRMYAASVAAKGRIKRGQESAPREIGSLGWQCAVFARDIELANRSAFLGNMAAKVIRATGPCAFREGSIGAAFWIERGRVRFAGFEA